MKIGIFNQILPLFIVSKSGNYKAPCLNFLCYLVLIMNQEYWPDKDLFCAFLAIIFLEGMETIFGSYLLFLLVEGQAYTKSILC